MNKNVLVVGAGSGLSYSVASRFAREGFDISLACRHPESIADLSRSISATSYACDVTEEGQVHRLFAELLDQDRGPEIVIYNAGYYERGSIATISGKAVRASMSVNAMGAFYLAQAAAKIMLKAKSGVMLFTGASASRKGYAESAPFAMGKFALRGLCQSLARELAPENIHVAHCIIDGLIRSDVRGEAYQNINSTLSPEAIADTYYHLAMQDSSAWTWEIELRPANETF